MSNYRIIMDMDGVLYPFEEAFNTLLVKHGEEPIAFDRWLDFSTMPGDGVEKVWKDPDLFRLGKPYPGTQEMMLKLHEIDDIEVYYVTSFGRNPDITVPAKWLWLHEHFPWVSERNFAATCVKWLFRADLIVEDFPSNISKWLRFNPEGNAVMIRQTWNENRVKAMKKRGVAVFDDGVAGLDEFIKEIRSK